MCKGVKGLHTWSSSKVSSICKRSLRRIDKSCSGGTDHPKSAKLGLEKRREMRKHVRMKRERRHFLTVVQHLAIAAHPNSLRFYVIFERTWKYTLDFSGFRFSFWCANLDCQSCRCPDGLQMMSAVVGAGVKDGVDGGDHQAGVGGEALGGCWHHQAAPQLPCAHHLRPAWASWKVATISSGKNDISVVMLYSYDQAAMHCNDMKVDQDWQRQTHTKIRAKPIWAFFSLSNVSIPPKILNQA